MIKGHSLIGECEALVDSDLESQVFFVSEPCEEVLDKLGCVVAIEKRYFFELVFHFVFGQELSHEWVDDVDDVSDFLDFNSNSLDLLLGG